MLPNPLIAYPPTLPPASPPPRSFWPEFWVLFAAGLLAYAISAYITHYSVNSVLTLYLDVREYAVGHTLAAIGAVETIITLALTVSVGLAAAYSTGLGAPVIEALLRRNRASPRLTPILVSTVTAGILIGLWTILLHSALFHRHHEQQSNDDYNTFYHSPAGEKYSHLQDRLLRDAPPYRLTAPVEIFMTVARAIYTNLFERLFLLSSVLWILVKLTRAPPLQPSSKIIWIAILVAYGLSDVLGHAAAFMNGLTYAPYLVGLHTHTDPFWLYALLALWSFALWLPAVLLLGWLYARRGLEACILASFIGALIADAHFYSYFILNFFHS